MKRALLFALAVLWLCGWSLAEMPTRAHAENLLLVAEARETARPAQNATIPESASASEGQQPAPKAEAAPEKNKDTDNGAEQDGQGLLELALKTINLSQGEGGLELWRLKAEWANMQKEDGRIVVERPSLAYFMPEKNKEEKQKTLFVTSESGVVDQKEQILRFENQVHITMDDKTIQGDLLVYNGTAKTMTLPNGGEFTGTGISGTAPFLVWDMNNKTIRAEGGVAVEFAGSEAPNPLTPEQER